MPSKAGRSINNGSDSIEIACYSHHNVAVNSCLGDLRYTECSTSPSVSLLMR